MTLHDFLLCHRDEILTRLGKRLSARNAPRAVDEAQAAGPSEFLDHLSGALERATAPDLALRANLEESASQHGRDLFQRGFTIAQVVHKYGDLCQEITGLALELNAPIGVAEFKTLNLCLDDAIAGALTAYERQRDVVITNEGAERLGYVAHEMRNALSNVMMSIASIRWGIVGPTGSTGAILDRNLIRLQTLIDRSLADVRLDAGIRNLERVAVWELIEDVEISAAMVARSRGLHLAVTPVDRTVTVDADRQIFAGALGNLLQNALKFTKPNTTVWLKTTTTTDRVVIEVEDACGGLPPGAAGTLLQPFVQKGDDRTGLGLGLAICLKAVKAMSGELRIRDLPGRGCVFTVDLPKQSPLPTSTPGA